MAKKNIRAYIAIGSMVFVAGGFVGLTQFTMPKVVTNVEEIADIRVEQKGIKKDIEYIKKEQTEMRNEGKEFYKEQRSINTEILSRLPRNHD